MQRNQVGSWAVLAWLIAPSVLVAADASWAEKMFDSRRHDFGVVAKAAKSTHRFTITNIYRESVHIVRVKATCGCTVAMPSKTTLASGETAFLDVAMDTLRFFDRKTSVLTVVFDRPLYAEVRIPVEVFIRRDIVLAPGSANFQAVPEGQAASRTIQVSYAGRADWTIKQLEVKSPHLEVRLEEIRRGKQTGTTIGQVGYNIVVDLKPTAPAGNFREQVILVTDDARSPRFPVLIEGRVEPEFAVTPQVAGVVPLGTLVAGKPRRISVVLKGRKEFKIKKIECASDQGAFRTKLPRAQRRVHVLPLTMTPPDGVTELRETFTVTIDGRDKPVTFAVYGRVIPAAKP